MALKQYRVRFRSGATQEFEADSSDTTPQFVYFKKNGSWIHQVATELVETVGLADIPEPALPQVEVSELRRARG